MTFAPSQTAFVFRMPFPQHIQDNLVSASNPSGTITNSDLELAAIVMGAHLLHSAVSLPHPMIYVGSDNTSAVSWCSKGSTSSNGLNGFLLHLLAQLTHQCGMSLQPIFIHGVTNSLADFCSRSFHLTMQAFREHLQLAYPNLPS